MREVFLPNGAEPAGRLSPHLVPIIAGQALAEQEKIRLSCCEVHPREAMCRMSSCKHSGWVR